MATTTTKIKDTDQTQPAAPAENPFNVLADAISKGMDAHTQALKPTKVTSAALIRREGHARNPSKAKLFTRSYYQNGYALNRNFGSLSVDEIKLLEQITTPGKYIGGLITVRMVRDETKEPFPDQIHIEYKNKTQDQRIFLAQKVNSFDHMLTQIIAEQQGAAVIATQ